MALYIPHSIFQLARLLYVRPENFGSYHVAQIEPAGQINGYFKAAVPTVLSGCFRPEINLALQVLTQRRLMNKQKL